MLISHSPKYLHGLHPPSPHHWFMCIAVALCCPPSCPPHVSPTPLACILPTYYICILPTLWASSPPHVCCKCPAHLVHVMGILPPSCASHPLHCPLSPTSCESHPPCMCSAHFICILPTSWASSPPHVCHRCPAHLVCVVGILPPSCASHPLHCLLSPTLCESHPPCMHPTHLNWHIC